MQILFVYKGKFEQRLAGPELRYVRIAEQLRALGHECLLATTHPVTSTPHEHIINIAHPFNLLKKLLRADAIYLHGGGPVILVLSTLAAALGKRVYLDAYSPHWLELHCVSANRSFRMFLKIVFNLLRVFYAALVFDGLIVGGRRQLDLYRGLSLISANPSDMQRLKVIPFGCEPVLSTKNRQHLITLSGDRVGNEDFLVGWLGGMWEWFDPRPVLKAFAEISSDTTSVKMVFFGVTEDKKMEMMAIYQEAEGVGGSLLFLPWVEYDKRLETWSGLDLAVVWGQESLENDYAMRTRNFDCISISLPVVQNWDDCWGPLIKERECGVIVEKENLGATLLELAHDKNKVARMSKNMSTLDEDFGWDKIAAEFLTMDQIVRYDLIHKIVRFGIFLFAAPLMVVNYALSYFFGKASS